jgi:excinuclease UvrABC nuclease subunit
MFVETKKYKNCGYFIFQKGDRLINVSKGVPELPGVYYFLRLVKEKKDLVYIGKSGTFNRDGTFQDQLLRRRINNKQEKGKRRQVYFDEKIEEEMMDALHIYWFVTLDSTINLINSLGTFSSTKIST